jgi:hypothetical protein
MKFIREKERKRKSVSENYGAIVRSSSTLEEKC